MIRPPTDVIPREKEAVSPIMPMNAGTAPPPIKKAMGMDKDTAMFLVPGGLMRDRAAKLAGKMQAVKIG